MATKKRNINKKKKSIRIAKFDIDQVLWKSRQLFLSEIIDSTLAQTINKQLIALDKVSHRPILLWIDSPGGSIPSGLSIIDTMNGIKSPVVTIISGIAASMAGIISVCGDKRMITRHAIWMGHQPATTIADYFAIIEDRIKLYKHHIQEIFTKHTKLSAKEINKILNQGELWFDANTAKEKGIVDIAMK